MPVNKSVKFGLKERETIYIVFLPFIFFKIGLDLASHMGWAGPSWPSLVTGPNQ
jgi:hypothetical protein